MRIRKYTAHNTQEAIAKVKMELGVDALIINTKRVRQKGLFGYFKKPLIEVSAAIDEQASAKAKRVESVFRADAAARGRVGVMKSDAMKNTIGGAATGIAGSAAGNTAFSAAGNTTLNATGGAATGMALNATDMAGSAAFRATSGATQNAAPNIAQADVFTQFQSQLRLAARSSAAVNTEADGIVSANPEEYSAQDYGSGRQYARALATPGDSEQFNDMVFKQQPAYRTRQRLYGFADTALAEPRRAYATAEPQRAQKAAEPPDRISSIESQIENLESLISRVYQEISIKPKIAETAGASSAALSKTLRTYYDNLIKNEVEPEYSMHIVEKAGDALQNNNGVFDAAGVIYNEVASALGMPETISVRRDKKPTVAIFVGPTGVGKTTTLAKIAADSALSQNLEVALITADTYRIAAVQQLKTYAEILGLPLSVAYSPYEIKECINSFSDKDLILIDTAGRSHGNRTQFAELRALVEETEADETFLVLSATAGINCNREIIAKYSFLKDYKLIFTKTDETPVYGGILNARLLTGKCLSYVTVGQSVPDDIEIASVEKIARNLIGSVAG